MMHKDYWSFQTKGMKNLRRTWMTFNNFHFISNLVSSVTCCYILVNKISVVLV